MTETNQPNPAQQASDATGHEVIEAALKRAIKADPSDAPFPLDHDQAALWHQAQASAYQHALEMIPAARELTAAQRVDASLPLNHAEALELAHMKAGTSNLARCYIALSQPIEPQGAVVDWRSILGAELKCQQDHHSECYVAWSAGSLMHRDECRMTEGVIQGIEYCIARLTEVESALPVAAGAGEDRK